MLVSVSKGKTWIITSPYIYDNYGIFVGFTNRLGGVSNGKFESLNLSYRVGDLPENVTRNRMILSSDIGVYPDRWVVPEQIHGFRVSAVSYSAAGKGGMNDKSAIPGSDGLITNCNKLPLFVLVADCVPVLLFDLYTRTIAAVHAGWRGVLRGIAVEAVRRMKENYGCTPSNILAFLGPHIKSCCLQLEHEIARNFENEIDRSVIEDTKENSCFVSLEKALVIQLELQGVKRDNIYSSGICTCCNNEYFSYRRDGGITGRQAGIIFSI